jgi:hypothetical protein
MTEQKTLQGPLLKLTREDGSKLAIRAKGIDSIEMPARSTKVVVNMSNSDNSIVFDAETFEARDELGHELIADWEEALRR